jgi:hypothetical protein
MESPTTFADRLLSIVNRFYVHLKRHFLLKVHYFLFFGAFGMLYPILNITLRSRGLSNIELSYVNIIIPFLIFIGNPLLGFIADHTRRYLLTFNFIFVLVTILYTSIFLLPTVKTRHIQANVINDRQLGPLLEFCASQEVATKCASRSECGCSYLATCTTINALNHKEHFAFNFSMNSNGTQKENQGATDMNQPATCGIQYQVPVGQSIQRFTAKHKYSNRKNPTLILYSNRRNSF